MVNDAAQLTTLPRFWIWEDGLSTELCDLLLKERATIQEKKAEVVNDRVAVNTKIRDSSVCWAPINHWIEGVLYNYGLYAAQETGWNYQLGRPEQIQLTAYDKDGFYGWHQDWDPLNVLPTVRKVSVIALLSDPSEFEGGKLQIDVGKFHVNGGLDIEMKRGTVIAFPSFVFHQVTPVTSGKRYSAVCWINGPKTL
jgi:predicted 2-oxoglutarate/Fe(II)-dependent dioxygenase YbiX